MILIYIYYTASGFSCIRGSLRLTPNYYTCTVHGSLKFYIPTPPPPQEPTPTATVLALEAISKHPELWPRYFSDFILHKMKLETDSGEGIAQKILEAFFVQLHE